MPLLNMINQPIKHDKPILQNNLRHLCEKFAYYPFNHVILLPNNP